MKLTAYAGRELPDSFKGMEAGFITSTIMGDARSAAQFSRGGLQHPGGNTPVIISETVSRLMFRLERV
jgi:hypothetical protein